MNGKCLKDNLLLHKLLFNQIPFFDWHWTRNIYHHEIHFGACTQDTLKVSLSTKEIKSSQPLKGTNVWWLYHMKLVMNNE